MICKALNFKNSSVHSNNVYQRYFIFRKKNNFEVSNFILFLPSTCTNAVWKCYAATPSDLEKYPKASDLKNLCDASKNMEFTSCEPVEPVTCKVLLFRVILRFEILYIHLFRICTTLIISQHQCVILVVNVNKVMFWILSLSDVWNLPSAPVIMEEKAIKKIQQYKVTATLGKSK